MSKFKDYPPLVVQITEVKEQSYTIEAWLEGQDLGTYTSELLIRNR
jgi:hypothetical protein